MNLRIYVYAPKEFIILTATRRRNISISDLAPSQFGFSRLQVVIFSCILIGMIFSFRVIALNLGGSVIPLTKMVSECENEWCTQVIERVIDRESWLESHGTEWELGLYSLFSYHLLDQSFEWIGRFDPESRDIKNVLALLSVDGALRVIFFIIGASRIVLAAAFLGIAWACYLVWPLKGRPILGEKRSNIPLFSPNILINMEEQKIGGEDERLLVGFSRPECVPMREAKHHRLAQILRDYDALTLTGLNLIRVILKNRSLTTWVQISSPGERVECEESQTLEDAAIASLLAALRTHLDLQGDKPITSSDRIPEKFLHQVIPGELQSGIAAFDPASIAVAVLSIFAGRALGGSGNCPGEPARIAKVFKSARAALLGIKEWSVEYAPDLRDVITKALLRAEQLSGGSKQGVEVRQESEALAHWIALLGSASNKRKFLGNKLEILALLKIASIGWHDLVVGCSKSLDPDLLDNSSVMDGGLILMPLPTLTHLFRRAVPSPIITRINELLSISSEREMGLMNLPVGPLTDEGCQALSGLHSLPVGDLRTWSIARVVLATSGWLARDSKSGVIPSHGLLCVGFKNLSAPDSPANIATGYLAIRGEPLAAELGERWVDRFKESSSVRIGATVKSVRALLDKEELASGQNSKSDGRRNVS